MPNSHRPLSALMLALLKYTAGRLLGATPVQHPNARTGTFVALIDRDLLTAGSRAAHALTTRGMITALRYITDAATVRAIARQLVVDAAHCKALASIEEDHHAYNVLQAES